MEHSDPSASAGGFISMGIPWRTRTLLPVPDDFVPLRLILQPSGATVEFTQPDILLGRHSQADVRLPLPDVSRRHCRFLFSEGVWQVIDLNSLNGVYLNGETIRQATLRQDDLLRIGGFTFTVDVNGANPETSDSQIASSVIRGLFKRLPAPSSDAPPQRRAS